MGISMSAVDYGRSENGIKKLKADLEADVQDSIKVLKGQKLQDLVNTLDKGWSGADKIKYIKKMLAKIVEIENAYKNSAKTISTQLDADLKAFKQFQNGSI